MHARHQFQRPLKIAALAGLGFAVSAAAPAQSSTWKWVNKNIVDRIQINGRRSLGYHSHSVDGDKETFDTLTYGGYGDKKFTDLGIVTITGRNVLGVLSFDATLDPSRYADPQTQRYTLEYRKKDYFVAYGDIQGSLVNTNRFASFNKTLRGAMAGVESGRLKVRAVSSESRGSARTVSFQGNNSSGPYYLQVSQIVRGSEEVRVDGVTQRLGQDYVINYEIGILSFINKSISPTSTISVSFEALGFNTNAGTVLATGASYNMGKMGEVGVTWMQQKTAGNGALSTREELFQGSGAASTPYFLQFQPVQSKPIIVRLDGILQVEGVDYHFDLTNPTVFFFNKFVPFSSTISVVYTPTPTSTVDGDREVLAFDYRLNFGRDGRRGYVKYSQATGKLDSPVSPLEGTAKGIEARYDFGKYQLSAAVRDVPDGYVNIETRGFNRNEKATDLGLTFRDGPFNLDSRVQNSSVSIRQTNGLGEVSFRNARTTGFRNSASYTPTKGLPVEFGYTRLLTRNQGQESQMDGFSLSSRKDIGKLRTSFGLDKQTGRAPFAGGSGTELRDFDIFAFRLDGTYGAGKGLVISGRTSFNQVESGGESGKGEDYSLTANYVPNNRLRMTLSNTVSNSGALAALGGFVTGDGLGYGGNGFSGGTSGLGGLGAPSGSKIRLWRFESHYAISDRYNLNLEAIDSLSSGSVSSNSETKILSARFDADLGKSHFFGFGFTKSATKFLSSDIESDATTMDLSLGGSPGRFSYDIGFNMLLSGGSSTARQDSTSIGFSTRYFAGNRHAFTADFNSGRSTGEFGQNDSYFSLAHHYQIWRNIALRTSYTWRKVDNLTGGVAGAYRSRGFDVELSFTFVPR